MINYYKTFNGRLSELEEYEKGCWINVYDPTLEEIKKLTTAFALEPEFITSALDEEETSHIDIDDNGSMLIVLDVPLAENDKEQEAVMYTTIPASFIITKDAVITVCSKESKIINDVVIGAIRGVNTEFRYRFVLQMILKVCVVYLLYLKQINKISEHVEKKLHRSMKNQDLIQLLDLEKSLVYFSTSLKANQTTITKLQTNKQMRTYPEDSELLDDVLLEVNQAIEMSNIYSNILWGTMDAFASIISNNLNIVMKVLASVTIIMAIPTMVSSFYGMNVAGLPVPHFGFAFAISLVATVAAYFILKKKDML